MNMKRWMKGISVSLMLVAAAASFGGCGSAGGGSDKQPFTIAYAPNESTEQSADARSALSADLGKTLGREVKEISASDYNGIIEALRTKKADMAYLGAEGISLANQRLDGNVDVIVMKAPDGDKAKALYHSVFITRADRSDINSLQDVKGKKMAFVDPGSTSGNLIPTSMIMKAFPNENLDSETLHMNEKFFASAMYAGKHQASIQAVAKGDVDVAAVSDQILQAKGDVDVAAVSDQILQAEINSGNVKAGDIKVIATSAPIPSEGMIIRADMDQNLRKTLTEFLLQYANEDYFAKVIKVKGARFVEASKADYQPIIELNQMLSK